jgi:hypothetical protein
MGGTDSTIVSCDERYAMNSDDERRSCLSSLQNKNTKSEILNLTREKDEKIQTSHGTSIHETTWEIEIASFSARLDGLRKKTPHDDAKDQNPFVIKIRWWCVCYYLDQYFRRSFSLSF